MSSAVQIVHRLHGEKDHELGFGGGLGVGQPEVQLTAPQDDFVNQLVDRVLVAVGKAGDGAAGFFADAAKKPGRQHVLGVLRRVGKQVAEVALVEVGVIEAVVF